MFDWLQPEQIVVASIVISLLSYFLSFRMSNYAQGRMLRTAALVLIGCSTVYGWATTDSLKFGFYTFSAGYLPIFIYVIWIYFKDRVGLDSVAGKVTPANFQFNNKKAASTVNAVPAETINEVKVEPEPVKESEVKTETESEMKTEIDTETETEKSVDDTAKDTGE